MKLKLIKGGEIEMPVYAAICGFGIKTVEFDATDIRKLLEATEIERTGVLEKLYTRFERPG